MLTNQNLNENLSKQIGILIFAPPFYLSDIGKIRFDNSCEKCKTIKLYLSDIHTFCVLCAKFTIRQKTAVRLKIRVPSVIMVSITRVKNCSWFLTKGDEQCRDCPMGKGNPAITFT